METDSSARSAEVFIRKILASSDPAYRLAVHFLGSTEAAEDVVQQAYLEAVKAIHAGVAPTDEHAWFLSVVANMARNHIRGEVRRRKREATVRDVFRPADTDGASQEVIATLRGAFASLEAKYRLPLALCYQEEMTQRQASVVLNMPESTVSKYVNIGLAKLRKSLERAGYPAAVAAVLEGLKSTAPTVPASLAGRVEELVAKGTSGLIVAGGVAAPAAAKGGLGMRLIAGIVLAGVLAAGIAVVSGGGSRESLLAEKAPKKKFNIPVWHPDARWEMVKSEVYTGGHRRGELDGPRREVMWRAMWRCGAGNRRSAGMSEGGRPEFVSYDPPTERYHTVTGSAAGYLDGPFSRARFGCRGYNARIREADSLDGRYYFFTDAQNGQPLRCLDFEKREVRTLLAKGATGLAAGGNGTLYVVEKDGKLLVMNCEGKTKRSLPLEKGKCSPRWGVYTALDETHGRLYGSRLGGNDGWYIWYWDLKDGKFHGVLPMPPKDGPRRKGNELGPFKGTSVYGEGAVAFGPDDPERRFLYMGRCDTHYLFRLDLEKQMLEGFDTKEGRFKGTGFPRKGGYAAATTYYYPPLAWLEDGSFIGGYGLFYLYRRVK